MYVVIVFLFVPSFVWFLIELLSHLLFYTDVVAEGISYNVFCFGDVCVSLDCCDSGWNGGCFFSGRRTEYVVSVWFCQRLRLFSVMCSMGCVGSIVLVLLRMMVI